MFCAEQNAPQQHFLLRQRWNNINGNGEKPGFSSGVNS